MIVRIAHDGQLHPIAFPFRSLPPEIFCRVYGTSGEGHEQGQFLFTEGIVDTILCAGKRQRTADARFSTVDVPPDTRRCAGIGRIVRRSRAIVIQINDSG
jgi:hypothetical protein